MRKGTLSSDAPFGTLLGYAPGGVAIYSSNYGSLDPRNYPEDADFRSYIGNEYMGHKWQCVEFARRFLFLNYGFVFTDVGMAWEIFSLRFLPVLPARCPCVPNLCCAMSRSRRWTSRCRRRW